MTNLEHYGFNNLILEDYNIDGRTYIEIYYRTKHSKDNIRLLLRLTSNPREAKVKWLLKEYEPLKDNSGHPWLVRLDGLYRMKHTIWGREW